MSRKLPVLTGEDVFRALGRGGFHVHHVKGGHHSLRHPGWPALLGSPGHETRVPRVAAAPTLSRVGSGRTGREGAS
jgi:predicted RNA binding protein YcfA (HicA-like mRNA interferase family)